jgi:hypothetical protein
MLAALILLACQPTTIALEDDSAVDSEAPVDSSPPEPVTDFSSYEGALHFTYDTWGDSYDCEDDFTEEGEEVDDEDDLEGLVEACPLCDHFYVGSVGSGARICDYDTHELPAEDWRGLVLDDEAGVAQVYRFDGDDGQFTAELLDGGASWDGAVVEFETTLSWYGDLKVEGTLTFEQTVTD